eukprot:TRINITY_DN462_c0_g6_i1.p1 TRINITY_DN462_c0_g6~~TRINITY_DN462_c0_g6_i1.p1  ORF type:complete len:345 (-),score=46.31 TRINITY_DN462_c0_g6_i1:389-1339(-)
MAFARMKRASSREADRVKVLGCLGLVGLVACAAVLRFDAAAFVSMGAAPLTGVSRSSASPEFVAPSNFASQTTASCQAVAACAMLAMAAAARSAIAGPLAKNRNASRRAVVRCANSSLAAQAVAEPVPELPRVQQPLPASLIAQAPLIELGEPMAVPAAPIGITFACQTPLQAPVSAAAGPAEVHDSAHDTASFMAAGAAFTGARTARVIGGARFTASRRRSNSRSNKKIRCYVAQNLPEVVPLKLSYDPSRLTAKMQAGVQVPSRVRKVYSRERKNCPAAVTAGSFTGVNDLLYRTMIRQQRALTFDWHNRRMRS